MVFTSGSHEVGDSACSVLRVCVCVDRGASSNKIFHITHHHNIYDILVIYFYCKYFMTPLIHQLGTGFLVRM